MTRKGIVMQPVYAAMEENPVIAAVRSPDRWEAAICSPAAVLFLLCGDIITIKGMVSAARAKGKQVFTHLELLGGIGRDNCAIDFIAQEIRPSGVISTRSAQIRYAKSKGLVTVQRFFLVDSMSLATAVDAAQSLKPDFVELMPGIMPGMIRRFSSALSSGIIAGGMIETKGQVIEALSAGARNVSTTNENLWAL
jgi:glycerol uptake operon antiterminator